MAEIVQAKMERFAPVILELRQSNIFTEDEVNKITNKIRKYEYKLVTGSKSLDDFKSLIRYEEGLLMELNRRKKDKPGNKKIGHLEWIFKKRILGTYRRGVKFFPTDYSFHMAYFDFLKYFPEEHRHLTNEHVQRMIQAFSYEPDTFRKTAAWFFQCNKMEETKSILLKGQSLHPKNLDLYLDVIELELKNPMANGVQGRLKTYVDEMVKNNITYRFLEEIVKIFEKYPVMVNVVDYVIEQLLCHYRHEPGVWHFVALRELKGDYYPSGNTDKKSTSYSIERSVARYKEGILELPSAKKSALWKHYLDTLVQVQKEYTNPQITSLLKEALDRAAASKIEISESHYLAWMDCCGDNNELLVKTLEEGVKNQSNSIILWAMYLKHHILQDQPEQAKKVFDRAIAALGAKSVKVWEIYIDFHMLESVTKHLDDLYERAISQPYPEVATLFKPRFLTWTILVKGIEGARELYLRIAPRPPYSKKLHKEMLLAEEMNNNDQNRINKQVLELWTKQFGKEDIDVYFSRITFVRQQGGPNINEEISRIYEEAIRNLADEKTVATFKKQYHTFS